MNRYLNYRWLALVGVLLDGIYVFRMHLPHYHGEHKNLLFSLALAGNAMAIVASKRDKKQQVEREEAQPLV